MARRKVGLTEDEVAELAMALPGVEEGIKWNRRTWLVAGNGFAAISRKTLLGLLRERALEVGAEIRYESPVDPESVGDTLHRELLRGQAPCDVEDGGAVQAGPFAASSSRGGGWSRHVAPSP